MNKRECLMGPSCLTRADPEEPIFVLRANDPIAPAVIEHWAMLSASLKAHESRKIEAAFRDAQDFREWRARSMRDQASTELGMSDKWDGH